MVGRVLLEGWSLAAAAEAAGGERAEPRRSGWAGFGLRGVQGLWIAVRRRVAVRVALRRSGSRQSASCASCV